MHKQCSCSHAKNENLLKSLKPYIFKNDTQMWKLHRKLNFPNIFQLAAIYTWALAFKIEHATNTFLQACRISRTKFLSQLVQMNHK